MKNHPHPGELLRDMAFEPHGLGITEIAQHLKMSRSTLSRVLNGHARISPDLAIRLEMAGISTARFWVSLQANYDLAEAQKRKQPKIAPLKKEAN